MNNINKLEYGLALLPSASLAVMCTDIWIHILIVSLLLSAFTLKNYGSFFEVTWNECNPSLPQAVFLIFLTNTLVSLPFAILIWLFLSPCN